MNVEELNVDVNEVIGKVGRILCEHDRKKGVLIHAFQKIQEDFGYLPEEQLSLLAKKLSLPLAEIYSVASFYKQFHFSPRGKKVVRVCMGTACHVRGAKKVLDAAPEAKGAADAEPAATAVAAPKKPRAAAVKKVTKPALLEAEAPVEPKAAAPKPAPRPRRPKKVVDVP